MGKEFGIVKIFIVVLGSIAISLLALQYTGILQFGQITPTDLGGAVVSAKLGKLELLTPGDPVYCLSSGQYGTDKTDYTANCHDNGATAAESLDLSGVAPTEDVIAGPAQFIVRNTGDGPINGIQISLYSTDPTKINGRIDTGKSGWNGNTLTFSRLEAGDQVTFNVWCDYEGGQLSAAETETVTFTGVATSGAKSNYKTFAADLNCTA